MPPTSGNASDASSPPRPQRRGGLDAGIAVALALSTAAWEAALSGLGIEVAPGRDELARALGAQLRPP